MRVDKEEIAFSEIKKISEERKSAFVRFVLSQFQDDVLQNLKVHICLLDLFRAVRGFNVILGLSILIKEWKSGARDH